MWQFSIRHSIRQCRNMHTSMVSPMRLIRIIRSVNTDFMVHLIATLRCQIETMLGRKDLRIVTCHLGNGSSLAAVKDGKCVDTTMGLTPLEGLMMGTRSGDIDPAAIPYLMKKYDMTAEETVNYLNKKSGVLGVSGVSSDFRDLEEAAEAGNEKAQLALDMFTYRIKKYIGAFAAAMGGVDVIAFAGGIGENDHIVRKACLEGLEFLGVQMDEEANNSRGAADLTGADSKVKILVVPTMRN